MLALAGLWVRIKSFESSMSILVLAFSTRNSRCTSVADFCVASVVLTSVPHEHFVAQIDLVQYPLRPTWRPYDFSSTSQVVA